MSGAYESLPHDKLIEVIGQALSPVLDELFTIRRYAKIWADSHEGLKKAFVRQVQSYTHIVNTICSLVFIHTQYWHPIKEFLCLLIQADFLDDNMGSTNMKGFVMSLQKIGKVHHTILVEQVRVTCSDISLYKRCLILLLTRPFYFFSSF